MKRLFLIMVLALMTGLAQAQNILGKWITEAGDAQVEIYLGPFYETQTWTRKQ